MVATVIYPPPYSENEMKNIRILSIQDISCVGQCSLTVALPILSALGIETAILPTALLSTHTGGFKGFTFLDLQEELPKIHAHWQKEGISFEGVYTGYLGSQKDVAIALEIARGETNKGPFFVDPAFGDHGSLYYGFDETYVKAMRSLAEQADFLLPNLTEAYALLGLPYNPNPNEDEIKDLCSKLHDLGAKTIVLKGVGPKGQTGIVVSSNGRFESYSHPRIPQDFHGTGDVFASVFVAASLQGLCPIEAGKLACDFVCKAIEATMNDPTHTYGVKFEPLLGELAMQLKELAK